MFINVLLRLDTHDSLLIPALSQSLIKPHSHEITLFCNKLLRIFKNTGITSLSFLTCWVFSINMDATTLNKEAISKSVKLACSITWFSSDVDQGSWVNQNRATTAIYLLHWVLLLIYSPGKGNVLLRITQANYFHRILKCSSNWFYLQKKVNYDNGNILQVIYRLKAK